MSEQNPPPPSWQASTAEAPRTTGPRVSRDEIRDVDRLRRSSTDRYVAGVAGGLGRHFDIDPTVVRVTLVVLTLFGGAGALLYAAVWLFVPEDGKDRAPVEVHGDALRAILVVAGVVAVMLALGIPFFGAGWGVPLPVLLIALLAVALATTRYRRHERDRPAPPWGTSAGTPSAAPSTQATEGPAMSVTDHYTEPAGYGGYGGYATDPAYGQQPPAWIPPPGPPYLPPPRPRRTGPALFWPTLALIAIGLGILGIVDISQPVTVSAYAALAVGVSGVMLVVGAFRGRPGGLIALGLASTLALVVTSIVGVAVGGSGSHQEVRFAPLTSGAVLDDYTVSTGSIELDLTHLPQPSALNGRFVNVHLNAGEIVVVVPREIDVHIEANLGYIGEIDVDGKQYSGIGQSVSTTLAGTSTGDNPPLELALDARVGQITVQQR